MPEGATTNNSTQSTRQIHPVIIQPAPARSIVCRLPAMFVALGYLATNPTSIPALQRRADEVIAEGTILDYVVDICLIFCDISFV